MISKDAIITANGFADRILNAYLGDLSDADLLVRPIPGMNHIAWQIGHLLNTERGLLDALQPGASPAYPDGFTEAHGRDEAATTSDDPSRFLTRDAYLALWNAQRQASRAYLDAVDDATLDAPAPERVRKMVPDVGGTLLLFGTHALMHLGQFAAVRRSLGKPVVI